MDMARQALQADELDRSLLEECLAELEGQTFDLRDKLAAAEEAASKASALETVVGTTKDQYVRLQADFENFRKRTAAEKDELAKRAQGDVVTSMLPVLDNFELARTQIKAETEGEEKLINSYQNLYKQLVEILRGLGVDAVPTVGAPFDPELHDAIMREPSDEVPDGTVLQEFRKGFKMGDRLLRPAMVKVSFAEDVADTPAAETTQEE